jgi:hypothetical protein
MVYASIICMLTSMIDQIQLPLTVQSILTITVDPCKGPVFRWVWLVALHLTAGSPEISIVAIKLVHHGAEAGLVLCVFAFLHKEDWLREECCARVRSCRALGSPDPNTNGPSGDQISTGAAMMLLRLSKSTMKRMICIWKTKTNSSSNVGR